MRDTVNRILDPDGVPQALPPASEELHKLTATVREHIERLAPEVEQAAHTLKSGSVARYTVLGCVWEERSRLEATPSGRSGGPVGHARRLARVLNALCDHYERIGDASQTSEQAALRRLGEHSASCPTCLTRDDEGVNVNLPCAEGDRLYDAYRKARRAGASPLASRS